jgi:hypothetical protein
MTLIDKIRAALEQAGQYIRSDLASERGAFKGHEGVSRISEIKIDLANNTSALSTLAELERAAAVPVAWMWNDELGIPHASAGSKKPVWLESSASAEYIKQANLRPLYTAPPPAPVAPKFEAVEVDDEMCERVWDAVHRRIACDEVMAEPEQVAMFLEAWRGELGPTLGMVSREEHAAAVEAAFREGWGFGELADDDGSEIGWRQSDARKRLESGR